MSEQMDSASLWTLFCATGEPVAYMLYRSMRDESDNKMS